MSRVLLLVSVLLVAAAGAPAAAQDGLRRQGSPQPLPAGLARLNEDVLLRPCDKGTCFEDSNGVVLYWITNGRFHSAELLARQRRFNAWLTRAKPRTSGLPVRLVPIPPGSPASYQAPARPWTGSSLVLPERIRETGRLDLDTLAIPYYRSVFDLLVEADAFAADCEKAYASRDRALAGFCAATRAIWQSERKVASLLRDRALLQVDAPLRLRATTLQRAFVESAAYGKALDRAFRSVARKRQAEIETDGIEPYEIRADLLEALEGADLKLTGALAQVRWAADAHRAVNSAACPVSSAMMQDQFDCTASGVAYTTTFNDYRPAVNTTYGGKPRGNLRILR